MKRKNTLIKLVNLILNFILDYYSIQLKKVQKLKAMKKYLKILKFFIQLFIFFGRQKMFIFQQLKFVKNQLSVVMKTFNKIKRKR